MPQLLLKRDSEIYRCFVDLIASADCVFFAGLPGAGKSLLVQQLTLMAGAAGRSVQLAQWDVIRQPFETPRYPITDGATHPLVIRAAGAWLRGAMLNWAAARASSDMLIGEAPLIGGRLMEIVRPGADAAEALLRDARAQFVVPVPTREVRALIEAKRAESIAAPRHENDAHDAPPDLLRALWEDLRGVGLRLGLADAVTGSIAYSPEIYAAVYAHLLRHRHQQALWIREPLQPVESVYAGAEALPQLRATAAEVAATWSDVEASESPAQAWYHV